MQLMDDMKARKAQQADVHGSNNASPGAHESSRPQSAEKPAHRAAGATGAAADGPTPKEQGVADSCAPASTAEPHRRIHGALPEPYYTQHDSELIRRDFSAAAATGIRALPDALRPDFRMQLYGALMILTKQRQQALRDRRRAAASGFVATGDTMTVQDLEYATARAQLLAHSTKGQPAMLPVRACG